MQIKTIPLHNSKTLCAVKVPEGAHSFEIDSHKSLLFVDANGTYDWCLPPGNWRILGIATELNDEQKKELLGAGEYIDDLGYFLPVYGYFGFKHYKTIDISYASFLAANKLYSENPFGEPQLAVFGREPNGYEQNIVDTLYVQWNEAQQHVGRWLLLIKD